MSQCAVARQRALPPLRAQIFDIEIVPADETDHAAIWAERFANFFVRIAGQTNRALAAKFVVEEIVREIDHHARLTRIELIRSLIRQTVGLIFINAGKSLLMPGSEANAAS